MTTEQRGTTGSPRRILACCTLAVLAVTSVFPVAALATVFDIELFYTRFSGAERVKKAEFSYDDATSTIGPVTKTLIATSAQMAAAPGSGGAAGADGIAGNPNDSGSLLVGGQSTGLIFNVNKSGGVASATSAGVTPAFHLEVADSSTMYVSGIPGQVARVPLNADGSVGAGAALAFGATSDDFAVTQVITTPGDGFFYTSSGPGGLGSFGTIVFGATSATTTQLFASVPAAHGGVYDPFTDDILLFGDDFISQFDLDTMSFVGSLDVSGLATGFSQLDQGTVDGMGHIFAADNGGNLIFVDYKTTGLITSSDFSTGFFLDASLDDVAPLVGGGTTVPMPEPGSLALLGLALVGFGLFRRRGTAM